MKITLSVIAHNEAIHAARFLASFAALFDELCICYALGNSKPDDTRKIVREWCAANGKEYRETEYKNIINPDWPHVDSFASARQASRNMVTGDVWFWADFDDVCEDAAKLRAEVEKKLAPDAKPFVKVLMAETVLPQSSERMRRERFIRTSAGGSWRGAVHEAYIVPDLGDVAVVSVPLIHLPLENDKKDPERNLRILRAQAESAGRVAYDIHREHFNRWTITGDADESRKACRWGEQALADPDLDPEFRLIAQCQMALCETNAERAKKLAWDAIRYRPDRREGYFTLAEVELNCGMPARAVAIAESGTAHRMPKLHVMPVNGWWYQWGGYDLLMRAYRGAGQTEKLLKMESEMRAKSPLQISVLHATRRPQKAHWQRRVWMMLADDPAVIEWLFGIDDNDEESQRVLYQHPLVKTDPANRNCVGAWNACAAASNGGILVQMSDDWEPRRGWDTILRELLDPKKEQVLDLRDSGRTDDLLTMAILTRPRYEKQGHLFAPEYQSMYSDNEFTFRAKRDGVLVPARGLRFRHIHPAHGKGEWDQVYAAQNAPERYATGLETFRIRNPDAVTDRQKIEVFTHATPVVMDWIKRQDQWMDLPRTVVQENPEHDDSSFGQVTFNRICWNKVRTLCSRLIDPISAEYIVHLDADIVLFRPFSELVATVIKRMDTSGAWIGGAHDPDTGLCGGLFVVRACSEAVKFAFEWNAHATDSTNDQVVLNQLLAHFKTPVALVSAGVVASYGNTGGRDGQSVWNGDVSKLPNLHFTPMAWHCNYTVGMENKRRMASEITRRVHSRSDAANIIAFSP